MEVLGEVVMPPRYRQEIRLMISRTDLSDKWSSPNKALHRTAISLRSIAAGELGRYTIHKYRQPHFSAS